MGGVLAAANLAGAIFMFCFLEFIAPTEQTGKGSVAVDALSFVTFLVLTGAAATWWSRRVFNRASQWMADERTPDPGEQRRALELPARLSLQPLAAWGVAAVVFGLGGIRYGHTAAFIIGLMIAIVLGGLASCAIAYLLVERTLRPLIAAAMVASVPERPISLGVRPRLILTWVLGSAVPLGALLALPWSARLNGAHQNYAGSIVVLATAGLVVGLFTTIVAAQSVADPLDRIRSAVERVGTGDLDVTVTVDDGGEVGMLEAGVNHMVLGLRERHRLQDLFGRHVGTEVARHALAEGTGLASEQRDASALFVDIVGSTAMAEILPPHEVVAILNAFFATVVDVVSREGGWVNKFEGDGGLCVFGAPAIQPDHAARALRAARRLDVELRDLATLHPGLRAAIGVSAGPVVAGNVGAERRYEYTIIGRPVNEAARLTELAKSHDSRVLAAAGAVDRAGDEADRWTGVGTVALRGQSSPTALYEPLREHATTQRFEVDV